MSSPTRSRVRTVVLASTLVVGGVAAVGLGVPAIAAAAASEDGASAAADAVSDRLTRLKDALSGLVSDGTITQEQADKVAEHLDETLPQRGDGDGRGGPGAGLGRMADLETLAGVLAMDAEELHTALHEGKTLAEIAEAQGVETQALIDAIVTQATARIDQAVTDGRITSEQAATAKESLTERVTQFVEEGGPMGRGGMGRGIGDGMGRGGADGQQDGDDSTGGATGGSTSGSTQESSLDT